MKSREPVYTQYFNLILFSVVVMAFGFVAQSMGGLPYSHIETSVPLPPRPATALIPLHTDLTEKFKPDALLKHFEVDVINTNVVMSFSNGDLFVAGNAFFREGAEQALTVLARYIHQHAPHAHFEFESFTDDKPILRNAKRFPTNWELTAGRSASILRVFTSVGFEQDQFKISGRGSAQPLLPNRTPAGEAIPDNQARNRRSIIRIMAP